MKDDRITAEEIALAALYITVIAGFIIFVIVVLTHSYQTPPSDDIRPPADVTPYDQGYP